MSWKYGQKELNEQIGAWAEHCMMDGIRYLTKSLLTYDLSKSGTNQGDLCAKLIK